MYTFNGRLDGGDWGTLSSILQDCFDGSTELQAFLREKFGNRIVNGIAWNKAFQYCCNDVVSWFERNMPVGKLITELKLARPDNPDLNAFIERHTAAGTLTFTPPAAS
jgi:hypothetical protein